MKKLNNNLIQIIQILNDGAYHDGDTLGAKLQITRSGVWKALQKLVAYGIAVDSVKGKGYALKIPFIPLQADKIRAQLKTSQKHDMNIQAFASLASTNDISILNTPSSAISVCIAEHQTQGRGRLGRHWHSPFGKNLHFSCLYQFNQDISELAGLSLVVSLAIIETLHALPFKEQAKVKWPNDIVYQGEKLAGSLIEIVAETHGICKVIIGIGINVNMLHSENHPISQAWTSLQEILGDTLDRNILCANLIDKVLDYADRFAKQGFRPFAKQWQALDYLADRQITLKNHQGEITGTAKGVDATGHLILQTGSQTTLTFSSGDTSVVKRSNLI